MIKTNTLLIFICAGALQLELQAQEVQPTAISLRGNGIAFTPNKGQIADMSSKLRPDILYKCAGADADIYLRRTGISYVYNNTGEVMHKIDEQVEDLIKAGTLTEMDEYKKKDELLQTEKIKTHRVDMDFTNCNGNIRQVNEDELEGYTNYYYAHCPNGITKVKQYNKVIYKNIYNNIDITYYGDKQNGIKYDLIVQPHADPSQIKLHWKGAESIDINHEDELVIKTSVSEFTESIPRVYQNINGKVVDVKAKYKLASSGSDGEWLVTFELGIWNPEYSLIIDPWITYYGGSGSDFGVSVNIDKQGNAVFTGFTLSSNFPVSPGAYKTTGSNDAFVVKMDPLDPSGNRIFATYFGGSKQDYGCGITTTSNNNILISGSTRSSDLPIQSPLGSFTQNFIGSFAMLDGFIAEFNSAGALIWSTCLGGTALDELYDICIDPLNNIYVTGYTISVDLPVLSAIQPTNSGGSGDCFVAKFDANRAMLWCSYYGGTGQETANGIDCDAAGNVFVTGGTTSLDFPVLLAFQPFYGGGPNDAFLFKLSPSGITVWATYFGGSLYDSGFAVATDNLNNIIITGISSSSNLATGGAFQMAPKGAGDAFVSKFNNNGLRIWSTYIGGTLSEEASGIAVNNMDEIVITGDTYSKDFPVTSCAYQTAFIGTEDQYIATFNSNGIRICSGYLGTGNSTSPNSESNFIVSGSVGGSVAIDGCFLYLVAWSYCNYPVTSNAYQVTCGGGADVTLAKLYVNTCGVVTNNLNFNSSSMSICTSQLVDFTSSYTGCDNTTGIQYFWSFPGGTPSYSTAVNPTGIVYNSYSSVAYPVKLVIQLPCGKDSLLKTAYLKVNSCGCTLSAQAALSANESCSGAGNGSAAANISNGAGGPYTYSWSNGTSGTTTNTTIPVTGLSTATYTVTITEGACTSTSTTSISSPPPLIGQFTKGSVSCTGCGCKEWILINATGGTSPYTYSWPDGYVKRYKNQLCPGVYSINIKDKNGCSANINLTVP